MTRLLIVEDQAALARALARALSRLQPDLEVLLAVNGSEATRVLAEEDVDLVLTDLRMPVMDGFELLTWLMEHRPAIPAFVMTAYGSDETVAKLNAAGAVECFTKPLNVHTLLERLIDTLAQSVRGHVQNVSLASFLQLMEMERKTCTLTVQCEERTGVLFMRRGQLVDARTDELSGQRAAIDVIAWPTPTITILNYCASRERAIVSPLGFIIMEAMRLRDEEVERESHTGTSASSAPPRVASQWPLPGQVTSLSPQEGPASSLRPQPQNGAPVPTNGYGLPGGARAIAVVETATGTIRSAAAREDCPLGELARMAAIVLRRQIAIVGLFGQVEGVEELVLSSSSRCDVIRPFSPAEFALIVFAPEETNLSMARLELERFMAARATS